ncbi:UDP-N-acetylglucosamine 2-epimerase (non-hydrolyzing) [Metapseudomonas otitidis]|uniref:non-hydrolyzing UDP-N-acetylglucosamine 2-epimerase n=1 Tax=Metapseudomonas otitidis TaxID=319939 RepID=UPI00227B69D6|nr:UDP-N-acetylglucosamine 2-epimerase (non-hydrolyzing) [Pseudomonas otitidis]WAF85595.1 UDP-N-acetylglucosamine 2-epimerase (non-hydrolyzing) [Pseudomonas otitidis]
MTRKIVTIVGARPQFIKAAAVSREILKHPGTLEEVMVHTGQHYDPNMSQVFFDELEIPAPKYNLEVSGGTHGSMTGRMLEGIEKILIDEKPNWVLIYGDTNSTLAGALAAAKLHIPVAHVEAGLRSFNMRMPEEVNRILSDRVSTLLLCPTQTAVANLALEGLTQGVHNVGDVMYDVALYYRERARASSRILETLGLVERAFALATCHRAENTDDAVRLEGIISALAEIARDVPVVIPLHPRTKKLLQQFGLEHYLAGLIVVEPLPFLDMVALEQAAKVILTDSGGVQKEAFFYQVPCITLRDETEWVETVELGWNQLVGASNTQITSAYSSLASPVRTTQVAPYGNGSASRLILEELMREY